MQSESVLLKEERILVPRVEVATSFLQRSLGLMGRRSLGPDRALYLSPCSAVHTLFMRFPIDLVFLDGDFQVRRIVWGVPPGRIAWGGRRTLGVIEMEAGWFPKDVLKPGDSVRLAIS